MKKNLIQWFRELLGNRDQPSTGLSVSEEEVMKFISEINENDETGNIILAKIKNLLGDERKTDESSGGVDMAAEITEEGDSDPQKEERGEEGRLKRGNYNGKKGCCPYSVKRNIVNSIREIERFAKEHELAADILKALLAALVELTFEAMKGKVNGATLLMLLNAINFDRAAAEAYKEGEIAGRNAQIEERYFPKTEDGLPHFRGMKERHNDTGIFSLARNA